MSSVYLMNHIRAALILWSEDLGGRGNRWGNTSWRGQWRRQPEEGWGRPPCSALHDGSRTIQKMSAAFKAFKGPLKEPLSSRAQTHFFSTLAPLHFQNLHFQLLHLGNFWFYVEIYTLLICVTSINEIKVKRKLKVGISTAAFYSLLS